jgi:DNA-directed RNA polymerase subunit D
MAVEEVLVIENTSPLPNEILAHRISLIPFRSDIDNYNQPEECTCNSRLGCDKCVVRYVLRAEATDSPITVYSRDMIPEKPNTNVAPVNGDIPIVVLPRGERVEMELYVRVGKGMKHTKWQSGLATLYEEDGRQYLYIESFGFLTVKKMLLEAVKIVRKRVAELGERLEEVASNAE